MSSNLLRSQEVLLGFLVVAHPSGKRKNNLLIVRRAPTQKAINNRPLYHEAEFVQQRRMLYTVPRLFRVAWADKCSRSGTQQTMYASNAVLPQDVAAFFWQPLRGEQLPE